MRGSWLVVLLAGCSWLSDEDLAERLDLDGDGVPIPDDCDPDDPEAAVTTDAFEDDDGDGAGDPLRAQTFCGAPPEGWVTNALDQCPDNGLLTSPVLWWEDLDEDGFGNPDVPYTDCNSTPAPQRAFPGNPDCDDADPLATGPTIWYADADGDGLGALLAEAVEGCGPPPEGFAAQSGDECDAEPALTQAVRYFVDSDLDGVGGTKTEELCALTAPVGYSVEGTDCDDAEPALIDPVDYYVDADGDGHGAGDGVPFCQLDVPAGYAAIDDDCKDDKPAEYPGRLEICDGKDQDCDEEIDEGLTEQLYYVDSDEDGFPSPKTETRCGPGPGYLLVEDTNEPTDCDDDDATIHPGAKEQYGAQEPDGIDHDCNPANDNDADLDGADRYTEDCDDDDPTRSPFFEELYNDQIDNDCDPATLDGDRDGDGYAGIGPGADDCDDDDATVNPGMTERFEANGQPVDDNCTGGVGALCGRDEDGDGYGDLELLVVDIDPVDSCMGQTSVDGIDVGAPGDCDDADDQVNPAALERCDGIDSNCDGDVDARLVTLVAGGADPLVLSEGLTHVVEPPSGGDLVEIDVCASDSAPIALGLDIATAADVVIAGRWTASLPDGGEPVPQDGVGVAGDGEAQQPVLGPLPSGPTLRQRGGGLAVLEGVDLTGDGTTDVLVDDGELLVADSSWMGVHAEVDKASTAAAITVQSSVRFDATSSFLVTGGRLDVGAIQLTAHQVPFVVGDEAVLILDGVGLTDMEAPLVHATNGTSATAISVDSTGAVVPLYDVDVAQLTDIAPIYHLHEDVVYDVDDGTVVAIDGRWTDGAGILSGTGGSSLFVGGLMSGHVGSTLFDPTSHDVSLIDGVELAVDLADPVAFDMDGDLTLSGTKLVGCPERGLALLTGDLLVEGGTWICEAERQTQPLFDVVGGDVTVRNVVAQGTTALPPALLRAGGGRVDVVATSVAGSSDATEAFVPTLPMLELEGADASLDGVELLSDHCTGKGGCTDMVGVLAIDTVIRGRDVLTRTGAAGIELVGTSFYGHSGGLPALGTFGCFDGETQTHTGPRGVLMGANTSMDIYACAVDGSAMFGTCTSVGDVIPVSCSDERTCVCLAISPN